MRFDRRRNCIMHKKVGNIHTGALVRQNARSSTSFQDREQAVQSEGEDPDRAEADSREYDCAISVVDCAVHR